MSNEQNHGRIVWRETMTKDAERAKRFYGELFNWKFEDFASNPGMKYPMIKVGDKTIGGLMEHHGDMIGMPSYWTSYVSVADIDGSFATATKNGGKVLWGPQDIPNVGRMGTIAGPDGAAISLLQPAMDGGPRSTERPKPGEFCWETLSTKDVAEAKAFWPKVIPTWKVGEGVGMPTFGVGDGMENQVADIQGAQGPVPPNWLTFVVVEKIEPSATRAETLGGKIMMPAMAIPNIGRIAIITDDQGAALGLFEPSFS